MIDRELLDFVSIGMGSNNPSESIRFQLVLPPSQLYGSILGSRPFGVCGRRSTRQGDQKTDPKSLYKSKVLENRHLLK